MICPKCYMRTFVKDSHYTRSAILRIRECLECGYRFMTSESFFRVEETGEGGEFSLKIIEINPEFAKAVEENGGFCPCAIEKNEDTRCPCKEFREQETPGECHCGRFEKRD